MNKVLSVDRIVSGSETGIHLTFGSGCPETSQDMMMLLSLRGCLQVGIFLIFSPEQGYLDFFWVENTSPKIPEVKNTK